MPADLVIFTEEILNGKLQFLCSEFYDVSFIVFWSYAYYCMYNIYNIDNNAIC